MAELHVFSTHLTGMETCSLLVVFVASRQAGRQAVWPTTRLYSTCTLCSSDMHGLMPVGRHWYGRKSSVACSKICVCVCVCARGQANDPCNGVGGLLPGCLPPGLFTHVQHNNRNIMATETALEFVEFVLLMEN